MRILIVVCIVGLLVMAKPSPTSAISCAFRNPLLAQGQDPSVVYKNGAYYLVQSTGGSLTVAKSSTITGLGRAEPIAVFTPPSGQAYSNDLWAPELAYLRGDWYLYFAATSAPGDNATHRLYALKADSQDPQGTWTLMGKVYDPSADKWAIDGSVFEYNHQLYMVWSGWAGDLGDFPQNLYLATMSDPLTLSSPRHLISTPDQPWEQSVAAINEGPEAFIHDGALSIVYSADASWSAAYKLGVLHLTGSDPLDQAAWIKTGPAFSQNGEVYGPGHNSMPVISPDGSESWLIYHAKTLATDGWDDRAIFAQAFIWNADGTPNFGQPTPEQPLPAGEPCGQVMPASPFADEIHLSGDFVDTGASLVNTLGSFSAAAWVQLDRVDQPMAILSQDGGFSSNFVLQFADGGFGFTQFDSFGHNPTSVTASISPEVGVWYHLVGVHDRINQQIALYVDGELQGTAPVTTDWDSHGDTILGAARRAVKRVDPFYGTLRDLRFYNGALDADEVSQLAATDTPGGWGREVTTRELPVAKTLAGVNMRLKPSGIRELHWHKEAEWAYMLAGRARITAIDPQGRNFIEDVGRGDLWNFPKGIPHSIQGLEEGCEFLLVFDDGNFSENETFLITDWFAHTPREVLAKNFGVAKNTFTDFPYQVERTGWILAGQVPPPLAQDAVSSPAGSTPVNYAYRLLEQTPIKTSGGQVRIVNSTNFPASSTVAAALVEINPGGMREMHWHPTNDEWQYYIGGKGRMTVFASSGKARTFDFQGGDVGYVPFAMGHYIENTSDEPLVFLEMFKSDHFADISLNQWMALIPPEMVQAHLNLNPQTLASLRKDKPIVVGS